MIPGQEKCEEIELCRIPSEDLTKIGTSCMGVTSESRNIPENRRRASGTERPGRKRKMRVSSIVGNLHDDPSPACMNGIRDEKPAEQP